MWEVLHGCIHHTVNQVLDAVVVFIGKIAVILVVFELRVGNSIANQITQINSSL
jgi:hypothetical protein